MNQETLYAECIKKNVERRELIQKDLDYMNKLMTGTYLSGADEYRSRYVCTDIDLAQLMIEGEPLPGTVGELCREHYIIYMEINEQIIGLEKTAAVVSSAIKYFENELEWIKEARDLFEDF